jgi:hypothetical protein
MLDVVKAGAVDAVIVYNLDRFTRNPDELSAWIVAAELNSGVKIISTGDVLDLSDDDAIFKARILLAVAEKESANISRRVKRQALSVAQKGKPRWNRRPFGFNLDGSQVESEASELRGMYADVIAGHSLASIALDLNTRAVPSATGPLWQSATIGFLIRAARNAGLRQYHGKVVGPATWEAVVDEDTYTKAVAALDARRAGRRQAPRSLLSGLVRCAHCQTVMVRTGRAYRCLDRSDGYRAGCGQSVNGDKLDAHVTGLVLAALGGVRPKRRAESPAGDADRSRAAVLRLQADLEEIAGMFGRGELSQGEFKAAKQGLDVRLTAALSALTHVDASAALERMVGPAATLAERWTGLDVALRSRIVATVIEWVAVTKADRPGRLFSADRVDIRWVEG